MAQVRSEWGPEGARKLSSQCNVLIVVDVLSFGTAVDVATSRGALIFPYGGLLEKAEGFARRYGAALAQSRSHKDAFSLSPKSLEAIPAGTRLVLPSPHGARVCLAAAGPAIFCACLRNAAAVARAAVAMGGTVGIVPAGERWPDGSLRPAFEDLAGAGAIASRVPGQHCPDTRAAIAAFDGAKAQLRERLLECPSGQELVELGYPEDVDMAAQLDVSPVVPRLFDGAFRNVAGAVAA
ncbi:MAG TPA: 2-phosphosulfolactate phosphatase [Candidatus Cybelea sp.]|nr:2-phosphosulfolactate phosphatase [Candidatus Cybelea sp.]